MPVLTRDEAQTRARQIDVQRYTVDLDLTRGGDTFDSRTEIHFTAHTPGDTFVELKPADLRSVTLDGQPLDPAALDGNRLPLTGLTEGAHELRVDAAMRYSHTGEGMHRFTDPTDGETYVYTQLFMEDVQRVFAAFDQPDLKAVFDLTVTAPDGWSVLANSVTEHLGEGTWRAATTPLLSTYLVAVAAGPWHSVRTEHRGLPFGLHCRRSLAPYLDADAEEILDITRACFDRYHEKFAEPYPFDSYDQAFVPEFNAGAMENPGLVTFRDEFVYRSAVTDTERQTRAMVVAHEMAHMWFGDLVTLKWWDDIWLNESFAEYMGYHTLTEATRYTDTWVDFGVARKAWGYDADQRPSTHPVAPEAVPDTASALLNFDGISYAKGASALRQLVTWLGEKDFLAGINTHFARHKFANATLADFIDSLSANTDRDVHAWADAWLRTTGVDTLTAHIPGADHDPAETSTPGAAFNSANRTTESVRPGGAAVSGGGFGSGGAAESGGGAVPAESARPGGAAVSGAGAVPAESVRPGGVAVSGGGAVPGESARHGGAAVSGGGFGAEGTADSGAGAAPAESATPGGAAESGAGAVPVESVRPGGAAVSGGGFGSEGTAESGAGAALAQSATPAAPAHGARAGEATASGDPEAADAGTWALALDRTGTRPHRIAVGLYDRDPGDGRRFVLRERVDVDVPGKTLTLPGARPALIVPNDQDLTYAKIRLDPASQEAALRDLSGVPDALTRAVLWNTLRDMVRDGDLEPRAYLETAAAHLPEETDLALVQGVLAFARTEIADRYSTPAERPDALTLLTTLGENLLHRTENGTDPGLRLTAVRHLIDAAQHADTIRGWLDGNAVPGGPDLDPELRWRILGRLSVLGAIDDAVIDAELAHDPSATGQEGAARCRAALPDPQAKEAAWTALFTTDPDQELSNYLFTATAQGFWQPEQADLLRRYVPRYFDDATALAARRGPAIAEAAGRHAFPAHAVDEDTLRLGEQCLTTGAPTPALRRKLVDQLDDLTRALKVRAPRHP
ncbi:aminopeptidase N [Streptomyces sp. NPDC046939]|uniref:aminopeptidase N n=1 Tax=Streptomyces sp. NPDC046939 TaxID=3155376 RepID=UPI0034089482